MALAGAAFSFREDGISDETLQDEAKMHIDCTGDGWELIRDEGNSKVLRRLHEDTGLYEFRCSGSYDDITANDFIDAQMDLAFRKKWDTNVEKLELVRHDEDTDSELIHWVAKFPYPMYPREYVFVRRRYIDLKDRCIVIANCAVTDSASIIPLCEKKYVRVETYRSTMVVRAHHSFDSKGFDYVLSYFDNPESNIPKYAYNWLINSGGPYYLQQVHEAAKELERLRTEAVADSVSFEEAQKSSVESTERVSGEKRDEEMGTAKIQEIRRTETCSSEEDSEPTDTAEIESDMDVFAAASDKLRCEEKLMHGREFLIFVD